MATAASIKAWDKVFIGGEWVEPMGADPLAVINSATEETIATIPGCTPVEVDLAVEAARGAFDGWSTTPRAERAEVLAAIAAGLGERAEELADTITAELGMPRKLTQMIQVGLGINHFAAMPKALEEVRWEEEVGNSRVLREAVGVVGAITPWNYPLNQIGAKVAPALAAGCTVVLKPSEIVPLNAFILAEVIESVGLPPGVFNLVTGIGPIVGEAIAGAPERRPRLLHRLHPRGPACLRAGRRVGEAGRDGARRQVAEPPAGGRRLRPRRPRRRRQVLPQLGPDLQRAHPDAGAARAARRGRGAGRAQPPRGSRPATRSTPGRARARSSPPPNASASAATSPRARPRARSSSPAAPSRPRASTRGYFVRPTVFSEVTPEMTIAREEIFGPVLAIMPYDDEDDAVRIANATDYGLAGGVWAGDQERAIAVAKRLRTGQIEINGGAFNPLAPFGGYGQSGHGRENGRFGLEEMLQTKSLQL